jgi:hypothetical protein
MSEWKESKLYDHVKDYMNKHSGYFTGIIYV